LGLLGFGFSVDDIERAVSQLTKDLWRIAHPSAIVVPVNEVVGRLINVNRWYHASALVGDAEDVLQSIVGLLDDTQADKVMLIIAQCIRGSGKTTILQAMCARPLRLRVGGFS